MKSLRGEVVVESILHLEGELAQDQSRQTNVKTQRVEVAQEKGKQSLKSLFSFIFIISIENEVGINQYELFCISINFFNEIIFICMKK